MLCPLMSEFPSILVVATGLPGCGRSPQAPFGLGVSQVLPPIYTQRAGRRTQNSHEVKINNTTDHPLSPIFSTRRLTEQTT